MTHVSISPSGSARQEQTAKLVGLQFVAHNSFVGDETMANLRIKKGIQTIPHGGLHTFGGSTLILLCAVILAPATTAQSTKSASKATVTGGRDNVVRITPIGQRTGEFCARDRAFLFEDPTGIRILYDPGVTVAGGGDGRLGRVDAILVSHNHYDHIGYRKLTQNPDDPQANCDNTPDGSTPTGNTNTAEIAIWKNSVVLANGSMEVFLGQKIQNAGGSPGGCPTAGWNEIIVPASSPSTCAVAFGASSILTRTAGTPGVRISTVAALHSDSLYNPLLLLPTDALGQTLNDNGLQGYDGLANGFVLTFTNGLKVYLTGDTGPIADMAFVVRDIYHPNLTVVNMDGLNNMGPEEAAYAMRVLVRTASVIPSHAEEAVTVNGKLQPGTQMAQFIQLLGDIPAYLPLSGRTMEFDGNAQCIAGCTQN
jgi:L-ascorbate metabolism protein UlaG (beta-lactamase superfamily)